MKDHLETSIFGDHDEHPGGHRGGRHDGAHDGAHDGPDGPQDAHGEPVPMSRREAREAARKGGRRSSRGGRGRGRPSVLRRLAVIVLALAVVGGGVAIAYSVLRPVVAGFLESNDYAGPGSGSVRITVDEGAGGAVIGQTLAEADVVKSSKAFIEAAKEDPKSGGIQPGVYEMKKQMSATDALAVLVDPANRIITRVVVPEGKWAVEIYPILSKATGIPVAQYTAAAKDAAALGLPASAKGNVEGYLFPASYEFPPDSGAAEQLKTMVAQSKQRLEALGIAPADMERVVVVASLIEAEAQRPEDQAKVSRVIANRLDVGMTLGLDSTVNYMFKKRGVPTAPMLAKDDPYNTRIRSGLPPGPIGNPGEGAIKAAVNPAAGSWLYFVTVNLTSGETKFTASNAEFQKFADEFLAWCDANPDAC